ncbi:MAG: hypothetical protein HY291_10735 [Planctomycetes bacterium]|nr:hypothetical protein [Planctomycetota bacterium]
MQIVYCSACGKRIKDTDLTPGVSPDKAACPDCAKRAAPPPAPQAADKPDRNAERGIPLRAPSNARRSNAGPEPVGNSKNLLAIAAAVALILVVLGIVGLSSGDGNKTTAKANTPSEKTTTGEAKTFTRPPEPVRIPEPQVKTEPVAKTEPATKSATPLKSDPTEAAKTEAPLKTPEPPASGEKTAVSELATQPQAPSEPGKPPQPAVKTGEWVEIFNGRDLTGSEKGHKQTTAKAKDGYFYHVDGDSSDIAFPLPKGKKWDIACEIYLGNDGNIDFSVPTGKVCITGGSRGLPVSEWVKIEMSVREGKVSATHSGKTPLAVSGPDERDAGSGRIYVYFKKGSIPERVRGLKALVVE